jgi:hypothetical protein
MKLDTQSTPLNKEPISRQETPRRKPSEPRSTRPLFTEPGLFNWLPSANGGDKNKQLAQLIKALIALLHGGGDKLPVSITPPDQSPLPTVT